MGFRFHSLLGSIIIKRLTLAVTREVIQTSFHAPMNTPLYQHQWPYLYWLQSIILYLVVPASLTGAVSALGESYLIFPSGPLTDDSCQSRRKQCVPGSPSLCPQSTPSCTLYQQLFPPQTPTTWPGLLR